MQVSENKKKVLRAVQTGFMLIGLVVGLWIVIRYNANEFTKNNAIFFICILALIVFFSDICISLIIKESAIKAGSLSKAELPSHYSFSIGLKLVLIAILLIAIFYYSLQ